ncbi:ROK family transcriptional regulator [Alicyclobacillus acidoterrestris]|uniref:ROK family protein n=1 Tax=Alicyclobacillus acidoterrestris (strain ATCC 49025 / DSM 3922 / CIP 106132 / NCIMB 13137 / GD3B) TaxID=1356854 RepID=A0A9E7CY40_ALIAG|nr:ROK family protein [Alicyclobacillus acidoterrestris]UNO48696.1 ROK family protein [Alicyclobacillus acidoterrestris]
MRMGTVVRNVNRANVLKEVRLNHPISRADIAKRLELSRSVVSEIVDSLIEEGFVREIGTGNSTSKGGRPSVRLEFVPTARYSFGMDIGGTKTMFMITDLSGAVIAQRKISSHGVGRDIVEHLRNEAQAFLEESGVSLDKIVGSGIGAPGLVNHAEGTVIAAPGLNWINVNLNEAFRSYLPEPIIVDNDVNMALLGEMWMGAGGEDEDVIFVGIGTGIGAALMIGGQIHRGVAGYAGEVGYVPVDPFTNLQSDVAEFGALEKLASGTGIRIEAEAHLSEFPNSRLKRGEIQAESVFEAARLGDELGQFIVDRTVKYLAFALSHMVALVNPGKIILGGGVMQVGDTLLTEIDRRLKQIMPIRTNLALAQLGELAGAYGAAASPIFDMYGTYV